MYSDPNCVLRIYDQNAGEQLLSSVFLRMVILLRMMVTYTRTCYAFTDFSYIIKKMLTSC